MVAKQSVDDFTETIFKCGNIFQTRHILENLFPHCEAEDGVWDDKATLFTNSLISAQFVICLFCLCCYYLIIKAFLFPLRVAQ